MKLFRSPFLVLIAFNLAFLGSLFGTASLLPERVASHFGTTGLADGWMSHAKYQILLSVLGLGLSLVFTFIAWAVGWMPARSFNLPRRDYWLSPEREKSTRRFISRQVIWAACLELLFFAGLHWLTIQGNRNIPASLPTGGFVLLVGATLIAVVFGLVRLVLRFTKAA